MIPLTLLVDGWAALMVTVAWQLAALALLAWLCERGLRLRQARLRHGLWWLVLLAPLALAPGRMALERREAVVRVAAPAAMERALAVTDILGPGREGHEVGPAAPPEAKAQDVQDVQEAPYVTSRAAEPVSGGRRPIRVVDVLALAWLVGCGALALRLVVGHRWVRRMLARCQPVEEAGAAAALAAMCAEAGVRTRVELRSSGEVGGAVLYGWRRPVVVVPREWLGALGVDDLRPLLAHEVAHVRRGDFLANLLQRVLEVVLFFHPAMWAASRRVVLAREELCDAWALSRGTEATKYARSLAWAAERAQGRLAVAWVGVAEGRFTLLRRVEAMMRADRVKRVARPVAILLGAIGLAAAGAFAAVQLTEGRETLPQELKEALQALSSEDISERSYAWMRLARSGERAAPAIPALIKMLGDETLRPPVVSWQEGRTVGEEVAEQLARMGAISLGAVVAALKDDDPRIRRGAAGTLAIMSWGAGGGEIPGLMEAASDPLAEALEDPDRGVRVAAARALGMMSDERALEPLLSMLAEGDPAVRGLAAEGLGGVARRRDERVDTALFSALTDPDGKVRKAAAYAVGGSADWSTVERLLEALESGGPALRASAAWALSRVRVERWIEAAVEPLMVALEDEERAVRAAAAEGLRSASSSIHLQAERLLGAMKDESVEVRATAAEILAEVGGAQAVEALTGALRDREARVRMMAADGLGRSRSPGALEPLVGALGDQDRRVRLTAAGALMHLGDVRAVDALVAALKDRDISVRSTAGYALGRLGDPRAVEPLIAVLRDERSGGQAESRLLRQAAAEALSLISDSRAVEALVEALRAEGPEVRAAAARALGAMGAVQATGALAAALRDDSWQVRSAAAEALGKTGDASRVRPLVRAVEKDEDFEVRTKAASALGRIGDSRALDALVKALEDRHPAVRAAAAEAVRQMGGGGPAERWIALLGHQDTEIRRTAAEALGDSGSSAAVEPLIGALRGDEEPRVREAAAKALGRVGDVRAVRPLLEAVDSEDPADDAESEVWLSAKRSLCTIRDPRAVDVLIAALDVPSIISQRPDGDRSRGVSPAQEAAAQALGEIGDARAIEPLLSVLSHRQMRLDAASALAKMKHPAGVEALIAMLNDPYWSGVKGSTAYALGRSGDRRAVPHLIALLEGEDPYDRENIILALRGLRDPRAAEALVRAMADPQTRVRDYAAIALGELGDRRAVEPLIGIVRRGYWPAWEAAEVLGNLGDPRAIAPLISALSAYSEETREKAAEALAKLGARQAVPALITGLRARTDDPGVRDGYRGAREAAAKALNELTGEDFGEDADGWEEWWKRTGQTAGSGG